MEELKKVFEERDSAFEKKTLEIFNIIHISLVCVTEFLNDIDPIFAAGDVAWEDANLIDDLVIVIGMVHYTPGTTVEIDGNMVSITEENLDYFQRVVHMSLPYDLVLSSDEDAILEFLHNMHDEGKAEDISEPIESGAIPGEATSTDFDLTKLTDEQRQALMYYNIKEKK